MLRKVFQVSLFFVPIRLMGLRSITDKVPVLKVMKQESYKETWAKGYKTFFMLNSAEHKI